MSVTSNHTCPRCQQPFACQPGENDHCPCKDITLSQGTLEFLRKTTYACLCNTCLLHFEKLYQDTLPYLPFDSSTPLMEHVHYYRDDGRWVFTELYHMLKGYCCQNGCRHCVYGFRLTA